MGFQTAANQQAQGTQQAMMFQALAAQQQAQALKESQDKALAELRQGKTEGIAALREGQAAAVPAVQQGLAQGVEALQAGQTGAVGALGDYFGRGVGYQQPYMTAGEQATNQLAALYGQGGAYTQQPTLEQLQMDPGYAFRFQQGQRAMESAAGAGGLRGSGAALKAATRYGQEAGSQEYQNAYARFMANRAQAAAGLQGLAQGGLSAAGTATGLAGQTGGNLANIYGSTGSSLANLYGGAGSNLSNIYTGTGGNIANAALGVGGQGASTYANTGNQLANVYGNLGQGLGQGAANIGSIYGQAAMGPTNLLASALNQGLQVGGYLAGRKMFG
jgi:hypothetical protein